MVSKYDVFYVIATNGEVNVNEIIEKLGKEKKEYQNIFNNILLLEKEKYVERKHKIKIVHSKQSEKLFNLISFCINNNINYNLIFKKDFLKFLSKVAQKEFFMINDAKIHPLTFKLYVEALAKYGFLLYISKKPLKCKLLRHHFFIELFEFFKIPSKFYAPKQKSLIKEINRELKIYRKNLRVNPINFNNKKNNNRENNFIYVSLNLEGNPLTLPETQKLIYDNILPQNQKLEHIYEVSNYKNAIDEMNKIFRKKLTLDIILNYHKLAMAQKEHAGKFRKENVFITKNPNFKTEDWKLIQNKINNLMEKYNIFESSKKEVFEIIKFASFFHNEFQRIHPFLDGNSRISRLLMMHILLHHQIPFYDLPIGYFDLYLDFTKRSLKRDDAGFFYLVQEIVLMNLKQVNSK